MKHNIKQLHIIPFDLGYVFVDVLAVDNTKNLIFAEKFVEKLILNASKIDSNFKVYNNLHLSYIGKKITKYKFINSEMSENAICYVKLTDLLYCYILANGTGVFVFADFESRALTGTNDKLFDCNIALIANYQKKISQATILNKFNGNDVFPLEEELMLKFRKICWETVNFVGNSQKVLPVRKYSSNINYKAEGLSYVLTIYLFSENQISSTEMGYLMYSPIFTKVLDEKKWDIINEELNKKENRFEENKIEIGNKIIHFSWAGVGIISNEEYNNYEDLVFSSITSTIIKSEIYVQSRWFIADNSMDNVNKSMRFELEKLQRIESLMEFSQAELDNEISANMNTMYKNVLEKIIESSKVRSLYKSVINQIHTQKKIKEAHNKDLQSRNRLITNLFLAIFTASSFFDSLISIIENEFSLRNIIVFAISLIIAIAVVIFDYKNEKE